MLEWNRFNGEVPPLALSQFKVTAILSTSKLVPCLVFNSKCEKRSICGREVRQAANYAIKKAIV